MMIDVNGNLVKGGSICLIRVGDKVRAIQDGWNRTHADLYPLDSDRNYDYKKGDTGVVVKIDLSYDTVLDVKMDSGRSYKGAVAKNWMVITLEDIKKEIPEPEPMWRLIRL